VNNYESVMNHKITIPLWLPLVFLVPNLFSQVRPTSPRLAEPLSAVELVSNTSLVPANEEAAAQFDEIFSKPVQINDGRKRSYVLAVDELYQPTPDGVGQIVPIKESSKPSTLASVANILAKEKNQETRLILYPVGAPHNDQTRRIVSPEIVIKTKDKESTLRAASEAGLHLKYAPSYAPDFLIFTSDSPAHSISALVELRDKKQESQPLLYHRATPLFLPNDPLFVNEWHIRGRGQNGAKKASDAKIIPVWDQRDSSGNLIRGTGVTIGIVDDGVQMDHPDLNPNVSTSYFYNWNSGSTSDPNPQYSSDNHGTAVAGVAAAAGFNGIGVTGVAPSAQIVPMRFIADDWTDADEAEMYAYGGGAVRIKNNSWGLGNYSTALTTLGSGSDYSSSSGWGAQSESPDGSLTGSALATAAKQGQIILFAAGNGQQQQENTNFRGRQNSIYTISVAAVNDQAKQCTYSTPGSSVVISAPSGRDSVRPQGTSTTDRTANEGYNLTGVTDDYSDRSFTENFNGTSSACPVASGVTALLLQANSSLNWRDVKEIYIRSATKNDSGDSDWARNAAGFWFNHKYGAGLINASDAVRLAKNWSNLGTMTSVSVPLSSLPATIRDNNASGLVKYFDTRSLSGLRVEHATVTTDITHPSRGELEIQLTSADGTTSRLAEKHTSYVYDPADYPDWTFSTVHNWGEDSRGLWKLKIADRVSGNTGTLNSATLTLYGTAK
jgi:subtilisin-like proprotein convertase family protein